LFVGWLTMARRCADCGLVFERGPGFFLGSAYINYGFMAITLTAMYMGLHFGLGWSNEMLAVPLLAYCVIMPLLLFRLARAWWLAMDCVLDTSGLEESSVPHPPDTETPS
jgi:uncharacterized protein (DUF983 family)